MHADLLFIKNVYTSANYYITTIFLKKRSISSCVIKEVHIYIYICTVCTIRLFVHFAARQLVTYLYNILYYYTMVKTSRNRFHYIVLQILLFFFFIEITRRYILQLLNNSIESKKKK